MKASGPWTHHTEEVGHALLMSKKKKKKKKKKKFFYPFEAVGIELKET